MSYLHIVASFLQPAPQMEIKFWLSPSAKRRWNPCSGRQPVYLDLSMHYDWPVKKAMVKLPIGSKGNSKCISSNSLSPFEAQNKYISTASQTLLTGVRVRLRCRLVFLGDNKQHLNNGNERLCTEGHHRKREKPESY